MAYRQGQISKYRNYKAAPLHQKFHLENLHNIASTCPSESELIQANSDRVAIPLNKPGGKIAIFELSKPGRQQCGVIPALVHGTKVMDFMWDPFNNRRLVVGCDDGRLWVWIIPTEGLEESSNTPEYTMNAHSEKIYFIRFHPLAENVLATGSHDGTIRIWDLSKQAQMIIIQLPPTHVQVFCFAWSQCGNKFAVACKDGKVRIYEPRLDTNPLVEGNGPTGFRGGRIVWVLEGKFLLVAGFDRSSERQLYLLSSKDLEKITTISLDSSPTILIPFYDEDSSVLLLSGRGDQTIFAFDIIPDPPYLRQLEHHRCGAPHLGLSFLKKNSCDVRLVEFARTLRLTETTLEPWSFTVPRVKSEYFQEDLFPPTKCLWEATMGGSEWFDGQNVRPKRISLKPLHMKSTNILPEIRWRSVEAPSEKSSISTCIERSKTEPIKSTIFSSNEKFDDLKENLKEFEESSYEGNMKKIIPEPLPRKKSISSGSSSDDVSDTGNGRPVPRPRFKPNGNTVPILRTPSSFLTKMYQKRGSSTDDDDREEEKIDIPSTVQDAFVNECPENPENNNTGDTDVTEIEKFVQDGEESLTNGNSKYILDDIVSQNGNAESHPTEDGESIENSNPPNNNVSIQSDIILSPESPPARQLSVAERLKIYSQLHPVDDKGSSCDNKPNLINHEPLHPVEEPKIVRPIAPVPKEIIRQIAPIKPERKFTPPVVKPEEGKTSPPPARFPKKRIDTVFGQVSKFRNFKAVPVHKKFHVENLRQISTTCPSESELIQGNPERVAVPLSTPGGKLAVFELSKPGRQPDGVIPALVHGTKVMDFMWDPFDNSRLVVGCDDGRLFIWTIPSEGLKEQTNEPDIAIHAHAEKIFFTTFHPLAKDVLASGSYDLTIRIWDLNKREAKILIQLENFQIQIFTFAWSPCGSKFATACKDGKVRVYEPRLMTSAVLEAQGPTGVRGGRIVWVLDGKFIIMAGFDRSSERQLHMYSSKDLSKVFTTSLDVSPAILVPFYDEDSSVLLLSGRGDSTIFSFDVLDEVPFLRKLNDHRCTSAHQGLSFLKKNACDVRNVEFAKALRLTECSVEPWSFTVPRVKNEFFQDDLFPPTLCLWEPSMDSLQWFEGQDSKPKRVNLKPASMKSVGEVGLSGTPAQESSEKGSLIDSQVIHEQEQRKKEIGYDLEETMRKNVVLNMKLEQDSMEGVDESEWTD